MGHRGASFRFPLSGTVEEAAVPDPWDHGGHGRRPPGCTSFGRPPTPCGGPSGEGFQPKGAMEVRLSIGLLWVVLLVFGS
ncbi:MAG: hypothetical protein DRI26_08480, partial [Chloroflexi bacterium]